MKIVSFYCDVDNSTYYSDSAKKLSAACDSLGISYDFRNINHSDTWIENTRFKPSFILQMLNELNEDLIWLDIDSMVHKKIDFNISNNWLSTYNENDGYPHSFAHIIKNNKSNKRFIEKWIRKINESNGADHTAFIGIYKQLDFSKIPRGYFSLGNESNVKSKKEYFKNIL